MVYKAVLKKNFLFPQRTKPQKIVLIFKVSDIAETKIFQNLINGG